MGEVEVDKLDISEMERTARQLAREKANAEMWSVDIAIFMVGVLAIILILMLQGIGAEIAQPIAIFGLGMGWLVGWRQGRRLYQRYYDEELVRLEDKFRGTDKETVEDTLEEKVRRVLTDRWREGRY